MKKYDHLRKKALELRKKGMALGAICERLALPKTTVYYWIRGTSIGRTERQTKGQKKGAAAMQKKYAKIRAEAKAGALADAPKRFCNPLFRDFIMLYLTEGYRRDRNVVSVCNSNPQLVKLADRYIRYLSGKEPAYQLQCHVDNDERELKSFWGDLLEVDPSVIKISRKSNSGQMSGRTWRSVHGVLAVRVCSTDLRSRLDGWMEYLQAQWN